MFRKYYIFAVYLSDDHSWRKNYDRCRCKLARDVIPFLRLCCIPIISNAIGWHYTELLCADVPLHAQNQAVPRNKDSVKTGRMEGLLEEMRLMIESAAVLATRCSNEGGGQWTMHTTHNNHHRILLLSHNSRECNLAVSQLKVSWQFSRIKMC